MDVLIQRQKDLEQLSFDISYEKMQRVIRERIKAGAGDDLLEGRIILSQTVERAADKIREYFNNDNLKGHAASLRNLLQAHFDKREEELAYIVIVSIIRAMPSSGIIELTRVVTRVSLGIQDHLAVERLEKTDSKAARFLEDKWKVRGEARVRLEKIKLAKYLGKLNDVEDGGASEHKTRVGAMLVELILKSGINIVEQRVVWKNDKTVYHLVYTQDCFSLIMQAREILLNHFRVRPILIAPPKPWVQFDGSGGYYLEELYKISAVKTNQKKVRDRFRGMFNTGKYQTQLDTLNTLQKTAWQVNKRVYEVQRRVFEDNILDPTAPKSSPRLIGGLPVNEWIDPLDIVNPADYGEFEMFTNRFNEKKFIFKDKKRGRKFWDAHEEVEKFAHANNSQALMQKMVLDNAQDYLNEEAFYFSYQYDYRGRIYPIQQLLQPQGTGYVKALLQFKEGSKLVDEEAVHWFMVHGANCYGLDKAPYTERVSEIKKLHDDILLAAEDPIGHRDFWSDADDPYMFLAWCFEYADYSRDPENFVSHIAVALDATCSGLQFYSGLLLDAEGAKAVNVIGDKREDVYQRVADRVNKYLEDGDYPKELNFNLSDGTVHTLNCVPLANSIKGKVTRGIVKRNVMTVPYSVTFQGMQDQLRETLTELERANDRFWVGDTWEAANFIAILNGRAINEVVSSAKIGQEYLKTLAKSATKKVQAIDFLTPLMNFPFIQYTAARKVKRVQTGIGTLALRKFLPNKLDGLRMSNSIAPNFIHSLDADLMTSVVRDMTAFGCKNFHMIHDSFGVPAEWVAVMNKIIRRNYVELFKTDPLLQLYLQSGKIVDVHPSEIMVNTLDLEEVYDSEYIFS